MIRIGVLGAGHLGKIHLSLLKEIPCFEVVGFYDPGEENAAKAAEETGFSRFHDMQELIDAVDAIDIVTPTHTHFNCAAKALRRSKHVFIEKPVTATVKEARELLELAREADVKVQVGHVERFNPALLAVEPYVQSPLFIEAHRLAPFNPRGTDVSVVTDLMIHDIDIALHLVRSPVRRISASGVAVVSHTPDIANARLEFDNGCVANLTASRISMKKMRKMRIFQKDAYLSVDFAEKKAEIFRLTEAGEEETSSPYALLVGDGLFKKAIRYETPGIAPANAIRMELDLFGQCILNNEEPKVTLEEGCQALEIAHSILKKIQKNVPA